MGLRNLLGARLPRISSEWAILALRAEKGVRVVRGLGVDWLFGRLSHRIPRELREILRRRVLEESDV